MSDKPKVALYWCASCGGCEEAVVDLAEGILDVVDLIDIVIWPVAMDFKRKDIEAMADGSIVATFLNGAIRTTEQEEMAHILRRKSKFMIAFGACAQLGGIPGLANMSNRERIVQRVYTNGPTTVNAEGTVPQASFNDNGRTVSLPDLLRHGEDSGADRRRGLLRAGMSAHAGSAEAGGGGAARRQTSAEGFGAGAGPGAVRRVPAEGHQAGEALDYGIQAPAPGADRRREVPAGAEPAVHGAGHARQVAAHDASRATCPAPDASARPAG